VVILQKFAGEGWEIFDEQLERGEISLEECLQKQFSTVRIGKAHMLDELESAMSMRLGFEKLVHLSTVDHIPLMIVSAGLDFVIDRFLKLNDWQGLLEVQAPKVRFANKGVEFTFPKLHDETSIDFKQDLVRQHKRQGSRVIYIGDGIGDYHAARDSDLAFAIKDSKLAELLKKSKTPHEEITDFLQAVEAIKRLKPE
jgi:2-hydroxy-3-keto-5-methylthiopentenyl-1-phosphate phosphatase